MSGSAKWLLVLSGSAALIGLSKGKGKVIPLQARCGPEGG